MRRLVRCAVAAATVAAMAAAGTASAVAAPAGPDSAFGFTRAPVTTSAVSCTSSTFCMAVGTYNDPSGRPSSFTELWNGSRWQVEPAAGLGMTGVSCVSPTFCLAVGGVQFGSTPLQEWNGTTWQGFRRMGASPDGSFAVSCVTTSFCMTAGSAGGSIFNGTRWRQVEPAQPVCPAPGCGIILTGVSCPTSAFCLAVGSAAGTPLVYSWHTNNRKLALVSTPLPATGSLTGVSCASATSCLVVGPGGIAIALTGTTWQEVNAPAAANLAGVSCPVPGNCVAAAQGQALSWTAGSWQVLPDPQQAAPSPVTLNGISCLNVTSCIVVGEYQTPALTSYTVSEQWNGATWRLLATRTPSDLNDGLSGVSCVSARWCMTVGAYLNADDEQRTLAELWNGHSWQELPTPSPGLPGSYLAAVSCPSQKQCLAVGGVSDQGKVTPLAEVWNGRRWSLSAPLPSDSNSQLASVSCSRGNVCVAVGRGWQPSRTDTLAELWNGSAWRILPTPDPEQINDPNHFDTLTSVSCVAGGDCEAVGTERVPDGPDPLAIGWNGSTWTLQGKDNLLGAQFSSVSCVSASQCVAVGSRTELPRVALIPMAETWNGHSWHSHIQPVQPDSGQAGELNAVACTSAACLAVGATVGPGTVGESIQAWHGGTWTKIKVTSLSSSFTDLLGISCASATSCLAVGEVSIQRAMAAQWNGKSWHAMNALNP